MKKINKTEEYEKLRKIAEANGLNQYDAAAHAMEMVLHPTLAKSMVLDLEQVQESMRRD